MSLYSTSYGYTKSGVKCHRVTIPLNISTHLGSGYNINNGVESCAAPSSEFDLPNSHLYFKQYFLPTGTFSTGSRGVLILVGK